MEVFGGSIVRLRNDPHWDGSPFEAADIRWDGDDGLQTISLFETRTAVETPRVGDEMVEMVEALMGRKEFEDFVEEVPSHLPDLFLYDAMVPLKMELRLVHDRLKNGWGVGGEMRGRYYRSITAVKGDLQMIVDNCLKYNETGSPLAEDAKALEREISQLAEEKKVLALPRAAESTIGGDIDTMLDALRNMLEPVAEVLDTPLPPYLVSYASSL